MTMTARTDYTDTTSISTDNIKETLPEYLKEVAQYGHELAVKDESGIGSRHVCTSCKFSVRIYFLGDAGTATLFSDTLTQCRGRQMNTMSLMRR
jgi:hypothetical protein